MAQSWTAGGRPMIAGHFGFAAMVKSRERTTPLWALMLATVWLDIIFIPLLMTHHDGPDGTRRLWRFHHPCGLHAFACRRVSAISGPRRNVLAQTRQAGRGGNRAG